MSVGDVERALPPPPPPPQLANDIAKPPLDEESAINKHADKDEAKSLKAKAIKVGCKCCYSCKT
jgi:hypothetical protein